MTKSANSSKVVSHTSSSRNSDSVLKKVLFLFSLDKFTFFIKQSPAISVILHAHMTSRDSNQSHLFSKNHYSDEFLPAFKLDRRQPMFVYSDALHSWSPLLKILPNWVTSCHKPTMSEI